jgi:hypothetical protein
MERKKLRSQAARIKEVRGQFRRWRRSGRRRRIPDDLWHAAAKLAQAVGVNAIARELGLDYYNLKRRTEELSAARKPKGSKSPCPKFVEVELPSPRPAAEVEVQDGSGTRVTIRLARVEAIEVAAIAKALLSPES